MRHLLNASTMIIPSLKLTRIDASQLIPLQASSTNTDNNTTTNSSADGSSSGDVAPAFPFTLSLSSADLCSYQLHGPQHSFYRRDPPPVETDFHFTAKLFRYTLSYIHFYNITNLSFTYMYYVLHILLYI